VDGRLSAENDRLSESGHPAALDFPRGEG